MISKLPHPVPVEQSVYSTEYDSIYQRKYFGHDLPRPHTSVTGYLKNAPLRLHPRPFGRHLSSAHDSMLIRPDTSGASRKLPTAHVRNQSTFGARGPPEPMISTTQATFTRPGDVSAVAAPAFRYAGDAAVRFNPDFLRIDEPEGKEMVKPRPPSPRTKWRTKRDGHLKVNPHDRLDVYSPPRFKTQVGYPTIADGTTEVTGAARMGGQRSVVGPGRNLPFDGTTSYRHFMVNQWKLPEPIDPTRRKKRKEDLIRLNQYEVSFAAAEALASIRGADGRLLPRKPELVHPTIWRLEVGQERSAI